MMTFKQFLNEQEFKHGKEPYWEWDRPNKQYVVYDTNGEVSSVHPYEFEYAVSKAYYAAIHAVDKLKAEEQNRYTQFQQHERPLTKYEQEYIELDRKIKKYLRLIKDPNIDEKTKAIYNEQLEKWGTRWDTLAHAGVIRQSIITGEHEATRSR